MSYSFAKSLQKDLCYIQLYAFLKDIINKNIPDFVSNCFDPIIAMTQYFAVGTKKTNDYEDIEIAITAATIEDLGMMGPKFDISKSSIIKVAIKDPFKLACKSYLEAYAMPKSYKTSFICEVSGSMVSIVLREALAFKDITNEFITNNLQKSVVEGVAKIPASIAKSYVADNFGFDEKYVVAEQVYRTISSTGKYLYNTDLEVLSPIIKFSPSTEILLQNYTESFKNDFKDCLLGETECHFIYGVD